MKSLLHQCTIQFKITDKPCLLIKNKAFSETEEQLTISVNQKIIFDEEGILLAEF